MLFDANQNNVQEELRTHGPSVSTETSPPSSISRMSLTAESPPRPAASQSRPCDSHETSYQGSIPPLHVIWCRLALKLLNRVRTVRTSGLNTLSANADFTSVLSCNRPIYKEREGFCQIHR